MYTASMDTSENYETLMEIANEYNWDAEDMLRYLTDWHGLQLLSHDFIQNLIDCEL